MSYLNLESSASSKTIPANAESLHREALRLAKEYLSCERELVRVLQELDRGKFFISMGYTSLYDYCLRALFLSESQAYNFVAVSRMCARVPELDRAIQDETLNVSRAKRILPVIENSNALEWIHKAAVLPQREVERQVVAQNPKVETRAAVKPLSAERSMLQCGVPIRVEKALYRLMEIFSSREGRAVSLEEALDIISGEALERHDPVVRAERILRKKSVESSSHLPGTGRRAIPMATKHRVFMRDGGRCRHQDVNGIRCESRTFLEVHHLKPVSEGGGNTLENLALLCSAHHRHLHKRE